jgi:hypothetical protein
MLVISMLFGMISIINCLLNFKSDFQISNYYVFFVSLIIAINVYKKRLKSSFQRHLKAYYESDQYKNLE